MLTLVRVVGGDSCPKGCEFESWHEILDRIISHLNVTKLCWLEKTENSQKEVGERPILKRRFWFQQPIHFLIMADRPSVSYIQTIMEKFIERDIVSKKKPLRVTYDFFNVETIAKHFWQQGPILFKLFCHDWQIGEMQVKFWCRILPRITWVLSFTPVTLPSTT